MASASEVLAEYIVLEYSIRVVHESSGSINKLNLFFQRLRKEGIEQFVGVQELRAIYVINAIRLDEVKWNAA